LQDTLFLHLQLAYRYLEAKGIPAKTTPDKNWQLGNVVLNV
jgi:hypothetical protein